MVSIIVPCYNAGKLLSETLENILQQTYSAWECLIIDDGSTDNSKEMVDLYMKRDNRFSYFFQQNSGPSVARNYGIEKSKGEYIQFLDSDDKLERDKLRRQIEILEENRECALVYGNSSYFYTEKQTENNSNSNPGWQRKISGQGEKMLEPLLHGNIMVIHSPLIRKEVFNKVGFFDPQIWFNEDWDIWLRCAINNLVFIYDDAPDTKALIRVHESNRSKDLFAMYLNGLMVCLKINKLLSNPQFLKIVKHRTTTHLNFLEKNILESYTSNKDESLQKANKLYSATHFRRHEKYLQYLKGNSFISIALYQKIMMIQNSLNIPVYVV